MPKYRPWRWPSISLRRIVQPRCFISDSRLCGQTEPTATMISRAVQPCLRVSSLASLWYCVVFMLNLWYVRNHILQTSFDEPTLQTWTRQRPTSESERMATWTEESAAFRFSISMPGRWWVKIIRASCVWPLPCPAGTRQPLRGP